MLQDDFLLPMSTTDNVAVGTIGEKGTTLSAGERQRIAIAQVVLKNAPILIRDEPTSGLGAHTDGEAFAAISHLMKYQTTFAISHRLTTIRRVDEILALENGRIVERGSHQLLLATGRLYNHLYRHPHLAML